MAEHDESPQAKPDRAAERAAARGSQSNPTATPEEVRYSGDELLATPRLLGEGITRAAVAGGLHASSAKTFTLDQAAKLVQAFLDRPADGQPEPAIEGGDVDIAGVVS